MKDLGKWPRLLVFGERVTNEQAGDILVRTNSRYFCMNNKTWERQASQILGVPFQDHRGGKEGLDWFKDNEAAWDGLGNIPLEYLCNHKIGYAGIGGPQGWCDWNGWTFTAIYNIGKWPSHDEVTQEWTAIAAAFPYLRLRAQLIADEGAGELAGTWDVADGKVTYRDDVTERVTEPRELSEARMLTTLVLGMEQGVSAERLQAVADRIRAGRPARGWS